MNPSATAVLRCLAPACLMLGCGSEGMGLAPAPVTYDDPGDPPWHPAQEESCAPVDSDDPATFVDCTLGSAAFGLWEVDDEGLPA